MNKADQAKIIQASDKLQAQIKEAIELDFPTIKVAKITEFDRQGAALLGAFIDKNKSVYTFYIAGAEDFHPILKRAQPE